MDTKNYETKGSIVDELDNNTQDTDTIEGYKRTFGSSLSQDEWISLRNKLYNALQRDHFERESLAECMGLRPDVHQKGSRAGTANDHGINRRNVIEKAHRGSRLWHESISEIIKHSDSLEEALYLVYVYGRGVDRVIKLDNVAKQVITQS